MPNLQQLFNDIQKATYFSRDDEEIWAVMNECGYGVYTAVLKEYRGYFIKWDETIPTVVDQEEYTLPTDLKQIIRISERSDSTSPWRPMLPLDVNSSLFTMLNQSNALNITWGPASQFGYLPYILAADTQASLTSQTVKIRIEPVPQDVRTLQVIYAAKWLEILNAKSTVMLPANGVFAMKNKTIGTLLDRNDDSQAAKFHLLAKDNLRDFLTDVRDVQIQNKAYIEPYITDLD